MSMTILNVYSSNNNIINGIYYLFYSGNKAAVTYKDYNYNSSQTTNKYAYIGEVVIPQFVNYLGKTYKVEDVSSNAFYGCSELKSVTIPEGVISIETEAFCKCTGLTSVELPLSLTLIGLEAFSQCSSLLSITIPQNVNRIVGNPFWGCKNLSSITVESGNPIYDSRGNCNAIIETATNELLVGCKNTIIPNSIRIIGFNAFGDCEGLKSLDLPNSITAINDGAFYGCKNLFSINIPNSVTSIGEKVFGGCKSLISAHFPENTKEIPNYVFNNCSSLSSFEIPRNVTSIGDGAFFDCSSLTSITIPDNVVNIGDYAFYGCSGLTKIFCLRKSPPTCGSKIFDYIDRSKCILYVPKGATDAYKSANGWKDFFFISEDSPTEDVLEKEVVLSANGYATFYNSLSSYVIPDGLSASVITSTSSATLEYKTLEIGKFGNVIPKGIPVVLVSKNRKGGTYTLTPTTESVTYNGANLLRGSNVYTYTSDTNGGSRYNNSYDDYVFYKLTYGRPSGSNFDKFGWYWGAYNGEDFQIDAGKAWLVIPKANLISKSSIPFMPETSGIEEIPNREKYVENDRCYNLSGQTVNKGYKGTVIMNGKKIIR